MDLSDINSWEAVPIDDPLATPSSSWLPMPGWLLRFYLKFPLVKLPAETAEEGGLSDLPDVPELWIEPPSSPSEWASSDPACLRIQLLFLLRSSPVTFRSWPNRSSAPEGTLPALHLPSGDLLKTSEIRVWLDRETPLPEEVRGMNGMPSQEAHTSALAYSHLILQSIYPAYQSAVAPLYSTFIPLPFSFSVNDVAGITFPQVVYDQLPGFVTSRKEQGERAIKRRVEGEGVEGVRTLGRLAVEGLKDGEEGSWFLGAREPSPLDALIASHIYPLMRLPADSPLRQAVDEEEGLKVYVNRVMNRAKEGL